MAAKKPKKWLYPTAVERNYVDYLVGLAQVFCDQLAAALEPMLPDLVADADRYRPDADDGESAPPAWLEGLIAIGTGWATRLQTLIETTANNLPEDLRTLVFRVAGFGGQVNRFNRQQFHAVLRSALSVDVFKAEPWLADELAAWEVQNLQLIKSIPLEHVNKLQAKIIDAVQRGTSVSDLQKLIAEQTGITTRRARLIARDQIGKLNGRLTEQRQRGIGVKSYRWRGVLDERERDEHVVREGKVYDWSKPPADGNPGQPIQCRCYAEAIFPDLEDMEGTIVEAPI